MSRTYHHGIKAREKHYGKWHYGYYNPCYGVMSPTKYTPFTLEWVGDNACIVHFIDGPPPKRKRWQHPADWRYNARVKQWYQNYLTRYIRHQSKRILQNVDREIILPGKKEFGWSFYR